MNIRKYKHIYFIELYIAKLEREILNSLIKQQSVEYNNIVLLTKYRKKLKLLKF
jgi:hypothetical protein